MPLQEHGDLHVAHLMVVDQFQQSKDRESNAYGKGAPCTELGSAHFDVESGCVNVQIGFGYVLASSNFTSVRGDTFKMKINWIYIGIKYSYDGKRWVISEHQTMKPSVIIEADRMVIVHSNMPHITPRKSPRNDDSSCFTTRRDKLKTRTYLEITTIEVKRLAYR